MNLTKKEVEVVSAATRANVATLASGRPDEYRTFHGLDVPALEELMTDYTEFFGNDTITRLPNITVFQQFLSDYPFFRVHGFLHNLSVEAPVKLFVTGIEYLPAGDDPLAHFDAAALTEMKQQFTTEFHTADFLHISEEEFAAEYHLDRLFEAV